MYAADLASHGGGTSSSAAVSPEERQKHAQHKRAFKLRRQALFQRNKLRKSQLATCPAGSCGHCSWWDYEGRIQCWVCKVAVCNFCQVTGHVLCHRCKGQCREEVDGFYFLELAELPRHQTRGECESCHAWTLGPGDAGSSRVASGTRGLEECYLCHRWLCLACRLDQTPAHCVVCPVERLQHKGHTGLSLRIPRSVPTEEEVAELTQAAHEATEAIGSAKFSWGAYGLQARIGSVGRAHRVGSAYTYSTAYATEGASASSS